MAILTRSPLAGPVRPMLARYGSVVEWPGPATPVAMLDQGARAQVRLVITNGSIGLSADDMAALPVLRWVLCTGVGHENVDLVAARSRGVLVSNTPSANARTVADHAMALLLAISRDLLRLDQGVRAGRWEDLRQPRPAPHERTLGLLGFGQIGQAIATRALLGFGMRVLYHARAPRPFRGAERVADLSVMAMRADYLVVACPGGAQTHHLVDAALLRALGPQGFLVNIGRGNVVDIAALIAALENGVIAGAALDVFEGEPVAPPRLRALPNVILTPHLAGRSPQALAAQLATMENHIATCMQGKSPPNLVHS